MLEVVWCCGMRKRVVQLRIREAALVVRGGEGKERGFSSGKLEHRRPGHER